MLAQCWSTLYDAGSTLDQPWVDVSCLQLLPIKPALVQRQGIFAIPYNRTPRPAARSMIVTHCKHWLIIEPALVHSGWVTWIALRLSG